MRTRSNLVSPASNITEGKKEKTEKVSRRTSRTSTNTKNKEEAMSPDHKLPADDVNNNVVAESKEKTEPAETTDISDSPSKAICENETKTDEEKNGDYEIESVGNEVSSEHEDNELSIDEKTEESDDKTENTTNDVIAGSDDHSDDSAGEGIDKEVESDEKETAEDHIEKNDDDHSVTESVEEPATSSMNHEDEADAETSKDESPRNDIPPNFPFPSFGTNPASLLPGQLQSISAQIYNNFSILASRAMMNVKQEPNDGNFQPYSAATLAKSLISKAVLEVPPRNDSRDSNCNAPSPANDMNDSNSHKSCSPAPPVGSDSMLQRPPSGLSPQSLALQLRNNDSASMVVSRYQKYPAFVNQPYPVSGGDTPPPNFSHLNAPSETRPMPGDLPVVSTSHLTSSPTLHHFTTRYTIETPADPSRLGVELFLDHDNGEPLIEVECGGNRGRLYVNKLCQGSKGQSINFKDEWLTPNEFQFISGRETAKDWKRSIRHCGKSLKTLMTKGILQVHPPVCECKQCRALHNGKILPNKKPPSKDFSGKKLIKKPLPFVSDSKNQAGEMMMRHGMDGGLSSIISQLHKANGFDTTESSETLDLTTKPNQRDDTASPEPNPRKRHRDDSPSESRDPTSSEQNGRASPSNKKPFRKDDFQQYDGSFNSNYPMLTQEEQYHRLLSLFNRSLSPEEHQRQLYDLAHNMEQLGIPLPNFGDFASMQNKRQFDQGIDKRSKGKFRPNRGKNDPGHAFDLSRKQDEKYRENVERGLGHNYNWDVKNSNGGYDRYRKSGRVAPSPQPADNRNFRRSEQNSHGNYITLESRSRDLASANEREDSRTWFNKNPDLGFRQRSSMIDLNSSGSSVPGRLPDWTSKSPWSVDHDRKHNDWRNSRRKSSPPRSKNGPFSSLFPDNHIILDRIPISKNPVTTLHHRPPSNYTPENDPFHPAHRYGSRSTNKYQNGHHHPSHSNESSLGLGKDSKNSKMPMLDLQKYAVPMVSLTHSKPNSRQENSKEKLRHKLSNNSDQEMKEFMDLSVPSPRRESCSAPPPLLSPRDSTNLLKRPTSAQADVISRMSRHHNTPLRNGYPSVDTDPTQTRDLSGKNPYLEIEDRLYQRNNEIERALESMCQWSVDDVCNFVKDVDVIFEQQIEEFRKHNIDGEGLPLLNERHLMEILNVRLGTALKLVARVKRTLKIYPRSLSCVHGDLLNNGFKNNESAFSPILKTPQKKDRRESR